MPLLLTALAACGAEKNGAAEKSTGRAPDVVGKSAWCAERGCRAESPVSLPTGVTNHPFSLAKGDEGMVEVQTRDTLLVGAGLMLWAGKNSAGAKTEASLVSFAKTIVPGCLPSEQHVRTQYTVPVETLRAAAPVECGPWTVRAGQHAAGYFVSVDRKQ